MSISKPKIHIKNTNYFLKYQRFDKEKFSAVFNAKSPRRSGMRIFAPIDLSFDKRYYFLLEITTAAAAIAMGRTARTMPVSAGVVVSAEGAVSTGAVVSAGASAVSSAGAGAGASAPVTTSKA
jgi:hypothetical protein